MADSPRQRWARGKRVRAALVGAPLFGIATLAWAAVVPIPGSAAPASPGSHQGFGLTASGDATTPVSVPLRPAPEHVGCPDLKGSSPHYTQFAASPPVCIRHNETYTAKMVTDVGTITFKLDSAASFSAVNNFVFLAGYHFYDGTAFHRVIPNFVDQGGDPTGTGSGGPGYSFNGGAPKTSSVYKAGALAMANSGTPASDGSQYFICVGKGCLALPPNYTYFGQVTSGMAVVDHINRDGSDSEQGTPAVLHRVVKLTIGVTSNTK